MFKKILNKIYFTLSLITFFYTSSLQAGGVHIGGGNAGERTPVSQEAIQNLILYYHQFRQEFVTALQIAGLTSERLLAAESQMEKPLDPIEKNKLEFQSHLYQHAFKKNIEPTQVHSIKIRFVSSGCLDNLGQENDASVIDSEINTICFSLSRLEQKLGKDNYEVELLALYIHELTHCFGSNELEAEAVQNDLRQLGPKVKEYLSFLNPSAPQLKDQIKEILIQINELNAEKDELSQLCKVLPSLSDKILNLTIAQVGQTAGQAVLGFNGILAFHGAYVVSSYLTDFCNPLNEIRKQIKFKGQKQFLVKDLYPDPTLLFAPLGSDNVFKLSSYLLADLSDAVVVSVPIGNREDLSANLSELSRLLNLALN